jgi:hypothetical protein
MGIVDRYDLWVRSVRFYWYGLRAGYGLWVRFIGTVLFGIRAVVMRFASIKLHRYDTITA